MRISNSLKKLAVKNGLFLSTLFLLFWGLASFSFAGGLVNNGAGHVEMNFQYVYSNIPTWIKSCLQDRSGCSRAGEYGKLYDKILQTVSKNRMRADRLTFGSATHEPERFKTGILEPNRIAVTGLDAESTILINLDWFYRGDSFAEINIPELASILLHELGHQSGETSHHKLDIMASELRIYLEKSLYSRVYPIEFGPARELLTLTVINQNLRQAGGAPIQTSLVYFNWSDQFSLSLTSPVFKLAKCNGTDETMGGYEIFNAAYDLQNVTESSIPFNFVLRLKCKSRGSNTVRITNIPAQLYLSRDRTFELRLFQSVE